MWEAWLEISQRKRVGEMLFISDTASHKPTTVINNFRLLLPLSLAVNTS